MRPAFAATLLALCGPVPAMCGANDDPKAVALAALRALDDRDAGAFESIAHPDLMRRIRQAPLIRDALAAHTGLARKLARVGGDDDPSDEPLRSAAVSSPTDSDIVALLFTLLNERYPRNRRVHYAHYLEETLVTRDLAIVTYQTTQKDLYDPLSQSSRRTDVLLRPAGDGWQLLWAPAIQQYIDPAWNACEDLTARVELTSDARTRISIVGVRKSNFIRNASLWLPPGDYEVLGTRYGYQEVRWLIHVAEDRQPISVAIACTQPEK